jgi:hypothetical protein
MKKFYGHLFHFTNLDPGLRVARVKVILTLPERLHSRPLRLAYVEWFWPFKAADTATGLYTVGPSIRRQEVQAEVIGLERIVRSCHLVPKFGTEIKVLQADIFEECTNFYLNPWVDMHMFYMVRHSSHKSDITT